MQIEQQQLCGITVLKPTGDLTHETSAVFRQSVSSAIGKKPEALVIDVSKISYVDSDGLEALVDARQELVKILQVLRLCGAREQLREVLELTGLRDMFEHFEDVTSAARSSKA